MYGQEELLGARFLSPEGMEHIRRTIDGIFELLGQVVEQIDDLTKRVEEIEKRRVDGYPAYDAAIEVEQ